MEVPSAVTNASDTSMVQVPVVEEVRLASPVPTPALPSEDRQAREKVLAVWEKAMRLWEEQQLEKPGRKRHRPNKYERQTRQRRGGTGQAGTGGPGGAGKDLAVARQTPGGGAPNLWGCRILLLCLVELGEVVVADGVVT